LRDVTALMPKNTFISAESACTMDIGLTQLPSFHARSRLNAGTYGMMGVGLGQAIAACARIRSWIVVVQLYTTDDP
jgi:2-hydroxyacyl-CoA lyase 1